jgi:hypothetical protein
LGVTRPPRQVTLRGCARWRKRTASRRAACRRPPQSRQRTGRNAQLNFKVTPETLAQFTAIADREKWLLAETLEHALGALTG